MYVAITAVPEVYGIPLYYLHRHVPCFCKEVSWGETGYVLEDWLPTQSPDGHRRARKVLDKDCRAVPVCPLPSTGFLFRCRHRQPTLSTHSAVVGRYRWALRSFLVTTLRYVFCQGAIGGGGLLGRDGAATAGHCNRCVGGSSPCVGALRRAFCTFLGRRAFFSEAGLWAVLRPRVLEAANWRGFLVARTYIRSGRLQVET